MNNEPLVSAVTAVAASVLLIACIPQDRAEVKADASKAAAAMGNAAADAARTAGTAISETATDATITAKVKTALLADDQVKGLQIDVDTSDQVATLTGTAQDPGVRQRAEQLALQVDGVKSVRNNISVGGGQAAGSGSPTGSKGTTKGS